MAQIITQRLNPGEFVFARNRDRLSEEQVVLAQSATAYTPATVLGHVVLGAVMAVADPGNIGDGAVTGAALSGTAAEAGTYTLSCIGGEYSAVGAAVGGNTGNGTLTLADPATGAGVRAGVYTVMCIGLLAGSGSFAVSDPDGVPIGSVIAGQAYDGALKFTVAAGVTDFTMGDSFTVTVTAAAPAGGGRFSVTAPSGGALPDLTVGTPYTGAHIALSVAAGATDWAIGDAITVTVASADQYARLDPDAFDGRRIAAAVLVGDADATVAPKRAVVIARDAGVIQAMLVWPDGMTADQKTAALAQLAARGVIAR